MTSEGQKALEKCPCLSSVLLFPVPDPVELEGVAVVDADLVDGARRRARRVGPSPFGPASAATVALEPLVIALGRFAQCCLGFHDVKNLANNQLLM